MGLFGLPEIAGCQLQRYSMAVPTVATRPIFLRILWKNWSEPVKALPIPPSGSPEPDLVPGQQEVEEALKQEEDVEASKYSQQAPGGLPTNAHLLVGVTLSTVCVQSQHLRRGWILTGECQGYKGLEAGAGKRAVGA